MKVVQSGNGQGEFINTGIIVFRTEKELGGFVRGIFLVQGKILQAVSFKRDFKLFLGNGRICLEYGCTILHVSTEYVTDTFSDGNIFSICRSGGVICNRGKSCKDIRQQSQGKFDFHNDDTLCGFIIRSILLRQSCGFFYSWT